MTDEQPHVDVRDMVAQVLGLPAADVSEDANLVHLGLKSLQLMQLVNAWRRSGLNPNFRELAARPTVRSWRELLYRTPETIH